MMLSSDLRALRVAAALAVVGCADPTTPDVAKGYLTGRLNGAAIVASAEALIIRAPGAPDSLYIFATRANRARGTTFSLSIRVAFAGAGTYELGPTQVDQYELVGGDGVVGSHAGSRPEPGELDITEYDERGAVLRGTVRFWLVPSSLSMPRSDPLEFTAGQLRVPVKVHLRQ